MRLKVLCIAIALGAKGASAASLPTTLDDVVILARGALSFGPRVQLASGQVVVNDASVTSTGGLRLGPWFTAQTDTQVIADVIKVRGGGQHLGSVFFDVFANTFQQGRGLVSFNGTKTTGAGSVAPLPLFPFPSTPVVVAGTSDLVVRQADGVVTLTPGDYGQINVGVRGTLILAPGTYNIRSLRTALESSVLFSGTTTLNVAERVSVGALAVFGPQGVSVNPRCIVVNVGGDRFRVASFTEVEATVNAPGAAVNLGGLGIYIGKFVGKSVSVGFAALLEAPAGLTSACP